MPDGVLVALKIVYNDTGLSSTRSIHQRYSVDFAMLQKLPRHRSINRFVTQFIDLPPDVVFDELSPELKGLGSRKNLVTGRVQRLKAQFYVVELHDMTLEAALKRFPVSARSNYPAPYACLPEDWCHLCVVSLVCECAGGSAAVQVGAVGAAARRGSAVSGPGCQRGAHGPEDEQHHDRRRGDVCCTARARVVRCCLIV